MSNVDLLAAEDREIKISYTPEAPAPAVAELTISMMLTLLRHVHIANIQMHQGKWHRYFGRRISEITIGMIGGGRIGGRVFKSLTALGASRILINEIEPISDSILLDVLKVINYLKFNSVDKETMYRQADLISIHVPLTQQPHNMIRYEQLRLMKPDTILINTSRGGIINGQDLARILKEGHLSGVALDVFEQEPYTGELKDIERCLLTSHMGSMSIDCRTQMEVEATEEVVRFFTDQPLQSIVPPEEYEVQRQSF